MRRLSVVAFTCAVLGASMWLVAAMLGDAQGAPTRQDPGVMGLQGSDAPVQPLADAKPDDVERTAVAKSSPSSASVSAAEVKYSPSAAEVAALRNLLHYAALADVTVQPAELTSKQFQQLVDLDRQVSPTIQSIGERRTRLVDRFAEVLRSQGKLEMLTDHYSSLSEEEERVLKARKEPDAPWQAVSYTFGPGDTMHVTRINFGDNPAIDALTDELRLHANLAATGLQQVIAN